jgi:hypothetical protein
MAPTASGTEGTKKATTLLAAAAAVAGTLALPAVTASAGVQDSYTVSVDPTSALPGGTVHVTATDSNTSGGSQCDLSAYTLSLAYTKVGGTEANAQVGEGTTDSDNASVDTTITVPADAASTDASGVDASVTLNVDCGAQPQMKPGHSAARPAAFHPPATAAALTISAFSGSIKTNPSFAFRGSKVAVLLPNCRGGPISAKFTSYGHVATTFDVSNYDATAQQASGEFTVPVNTQPGPGKITGSCWQTSYAAKGLFVNSGEEEGEGTGASGGSGHPHHPVPTGVVSGVAKHAHAVTATPTFTG